MRNATVELLMGIDVVDCELHGGDFFGFVVRNFGFELFFESHDQFDRIERISAKIFYEGSFIFYFFFFYAELFSDDFLDSFFNATHIYACSWVCEYINVQKFRTY